MKDRGKLPKHVLLSKGPGERLAFQPPVPSSTPASTDASHLLSATRVSSWLGVGRSLLGHCQPEEATTGLGGPGADWGHWTLISRAAVWPGEWTVPVLLTQGGSHGLCQPSSVGLLLHVAGLLQKPLPLCLAHCQSESHLLEDTAHSHLQEPGEQT